MQIKINKLKNIHELDIDGILSQSEFYTPECFEEINDKLIAMWKTDLKNSFIVGKIFRRG